MIDNRLVITEELVIILCGVSSGSTLFGTHPAILDTTLGSKLYLFKFQIKYDKKLRCLNTVKGKYG